VPYYCFVASGFPHFEHFASSGKSHFKKKMDFALPMGPMFLRRNTQERLRLLEHDKPEHAHGDHADHHHRVDWKRWGPYVSDRAWGTVREDYSADGSAWEYFPHDHARSRTFRWSEDGIGGQCDRNQRLCLALAVWNGADPILKERLFGLTGSEGNHGEDVKEYYFYLDNLPTHTYQRMMYKYPQSEFPYERLVRENRSRNRYQPEFELLDTGVFDGNRYFDIDIEYAKPDSDEDILMRVTAFNRGPDDASLHLLPHIWFRNTWGWNPRTLPAIPARDEWKHGDDGVKTKIHHPARPEVALPPNVFQDDVRKCHSKPSLRRCDTNTVGVYHSCTLVDGMHEGRTPGDFDVKNESDLLTALSRVTDRQADLFLHCQPTHVRGSAVHPQLLFCENETNIQRIYGGENTTPFPKDGINDTIVHGAPHRVNPEHVGTKAAAMYKLVVPAGSSVCIRLRLNKREPKEASADEEASFDELMSEAKRIADEFYEHVHEAARVTEPDKKLVQRQACARLL
jgi:hypothetical protein